MKVLKIVKQEKKTKEGKAFTTYLGIFGDLITQDNESVLENIKYYDVAFTKNSDINPNKIDFPLTLKGLKGFKTKDEPWDYTLIAKKDANGNYIKRKNGDRVYKLYIQSYTKDNVLKVTYKEFEKPTLDDDGNLPF